MIKPAGASIDDHRHSRDLDSSWAEFIAGRGAPLISGMKGYCMRYISAAAQFVDDHIRIDDIRLGAGRYWSVATTVGSAISEGLASAQHYDRLAHMIRVESAGRAEFARIAVLGRSI
jgi:hypothetical protein